MTDDDMEQACAIGQISRNLRYILEYCIGMGKALLAGTKEKVKNIRMSCPLQKSKITER